MEIMHTCGEACGKFQHICGFKRLYTITQLKPVGISLLKHTQKNNFGMWLESAINLICMKLEKQMIS